MLTPVVHSLIVAVCSTFFAFLITLPLSYIGSYRRYHLKWLVEVLLLMPLVLPPTVIGLFLLRSFGKYGALGKFLAFFNYSPIFTLTGAILATIIVVMPLLYQGMKGAFLSVPIPLIQAGETLGANRSEILWRIILPNCWSSVIASMLLAFCRALGEFGASLMMAGYIEGKTDTLATSIYFAIQQGDENKAWLLSGLTIIFGFVILMLIQFLTKKRGVQLT